jgi:hypothetical protein
MLITKQFKQLRMENTTTVAQGYSHQQIARDAALQCIAVNKRANQFVIMVH